jgi:DNA-binding NarL/FixJ family response regulator
MTANELALRVLIADDDERIRDRIEAILDAVAGIELVASARDGLEAVHRFAQLRPDVVLMDVVMPLCDGIDATKRILAIEPAARVVALTGVEDSRMLLLCLAAGAKACLKKSPDTITLVPLMVALAAGPTPQPLGPGDSPAQARHGRPREPDPDGSLRPSSSSRLPVPGMTVAASAS